MSWEQLKTVANVSTHSDKSSLGLEDFVAIWDIRVEQMNNIWMMGAMLVETDKQYVHCSVMLYKTFFYKNSRMYVAENLKKHPIPNT